MRFLHKYSESMNPILYLRFLIFYKILLDNFAFTVL